jgi:hypothetical protein
MTRLLRPLRFHWRVAVGEFLVVLCGVLLALAVDDWAAERADRAQEAGSLARLADDLELDIRMLEGFGEMAENALEAVAGVRVALAAPGGVEEPLAFLQQLVAATNLGWTMPLGERATFDELLATGGLALVSDPVLRTDITRYYRVGEEQRNRTLARRSELPALVYRIVPRETEYRVDDALGQEDAARLVEELLALGGEQHLTSQANYLRFVEGSFEARREQAEKLLGSVREHQAALGPAG